MLVKAGHSENQLVFSADVTPPPRFVYDSSHSPRTPGGETSDDPWRTFRPLAFRVFHDLFMKKARVGRARNGLSTNRARG